MARGKAHSVQVDPIKLRIDNAVCSAAEWLGEVQPGRRIFGFTKGQFSVVDIVNCIIRQIGRCDLDIFTWTVGPNEADALFALQEQNLLANFRLVADRSFQNMTDERRERAIALLQRFGPEAFRVTNNHAKCASIRGGGYNFALTTSGNFNLNVRCEHISIEDNTQVSDCIRGFADELFETILPGLTGVAVGKYFKAITLGKQPIGTTDKIQPGKSGTDLRDFTRW